MSLALIIAFAALLVLLCTLALLWSRWPAWMKTLLIVGVTCLYFYGHEAVRAIWGVPSDEALHAALADARPDAVALAGYMRVLGPAMVSVPPRLSQRWPSRYWM